MSYKVKNIRLAAEGRRMMEWAENHMPVLAEIRREFSKTKPLRGITIGAALHTESKTGVLVRTLLSGGAKVAIASCNPLSTKDEVAAALAKEGVNVYAWRGESTKDYYANLNAVLDVRPQILIDDGADLITRVHTRRRELLDGVIGASEETTTGVNRLRLMAEAGALKFPVIAVNDSPCKRFFDNRFGTAESTFQAITGMTNTLIAGKRVVVVGYGFVGRGIASRAKGLGALVTVVETDPVKALEAAMDGFCVTSMNEAAKWGELFITATGGFKVIRVEHMKMMGNGAILCNSGHFNVEIDLDGLRRLAVSSREVIEDVQEFKLKNGRRIYLLAEGRLVNLAGRRSLGHPMEIMDMSFALQALSVVYLARSGRGLAPKVYEVPPEIDRRVAELKLRSMGIKLEKRTKEQADYSASWTLGT
ncbi:MAG: adenosylhomocysteinase [Candidatus Hadarchaeum sp.]|uniref:adenosylhomocysteinase n=1 Tax=Candidatus Hadarchaeum sp. TaxID=2883567 RepID=UPI0031770741